MNKHLLEILRKPNKGEWRVGKGRTMSTGCIGRVGKMRQRPKSQAKERSWLFAM